MSQNRGSRQIDALDPEHLSALSGTALNAIGSTLDSVSLRTVQALTTAQIQSIETPVLQSLAPSTIRELLTAQVQALTGNQVTALTTSQLRAFKGYAEVQALGANDAAITDFTPQQVSDLTDEQFSAFRADQFSSFTPNQLAAARADQIAVLSYEELAGVTATQLSSLGPAQIAAFAPDEIAAIDPAQIGALPSATLKQFSGIQLQALTNAQLANVSATSLASLSTDQLSYFRLSQAQSLSAPQLSLLSAAQQQALFSPPAVATPSYTFVQTGTLDDPAFSSVQTNANGDLWALGANTTNQYGHSIYKSQDGHWQQIKDVGATSIAVDSSGGLWATAASGEIYHLQSDGSGWNHIGGGALLSKIAAGGGVLWGIGANLDLNRAPGGLATYRSIDGGQNWDRIDGYATDISVDIQGNAYAVNEYGTLFHYDNYGTSYNQFNPIADGVSQVAAAPNGAVYARSTSGGAIAKFEFLPAGTYNRGVFDPLIGYGDAVALGGGGVGSNESVLTVQNGKIGSFNGYGNFSAIETRLLSVTATPGGKIFALAATSNANSAHPALQWNGTSWDAVPLFINGARPYLTNISASDDGSLWAVNSEGNVLHTDGNGVLQFTALPGNIYQVAASASGGVWALSRNTNAQGGGQQILHATDAYNWSQVFGGAVSIAVDGSGSPWVVNDRGAIYHWNGNGFDDISASLSAISVSASGDNVSAIVNDGGSARIIKWNGSSWSRVAGSSLSSAVQFSGSAALGVSDGGAVTFGQIQSASSIVSNPNLATLAKVIRIGIPAAIVNGRATYYGVGAKFGTLVDINGDDFASGLSDQDRIDAYRQAYGQNPTTAAVNVSIFQAGAPSYEIPAPNQLSANDVIEQARRVRDGLASGSDSGGVGWILSDAIASGFGNVVDTKLQILIYGLTQRGSTLSGFNNLQNGVGQTNVYGAHGQLLGTDTVNFSDGSGVLTDNANPIVQSTDVADASVEFATAAALLGINLRLRTDATSGNLFKPVGGGGGGDTGTGTGSTGSSGGAYEIGSFGRIGQPPLNVKPPDTGNESFADKLARLFGREFGSISIGSESYDPSATQMARLLRQLRENAQKQNFLDAYNALKSASVTTSIQFTTGLYASGVKVDGSTTYGSEDSGTLLPSYILIQIDADISAVAKKSTVAHEMHHVWDRLKHQDKDPLLLSGQWSVDKPAVPAGFDGLAFTELAATLYEAKVDADNKLPFNQADLGFDAAKYPNLSALNDKYFKQTFGIDIGSWNNDTASLRNLWIANGSRH